jgi:hypothetical protein
MHKSTATSKTAQTKKAKVHKAPAGYGMKKAPRKNLYMSSDGTTYEGMVKQHGGKTTIIKTTMVRISPRLCDAKDRNGLHNNSVRRRMAKHGITSIPE